MSMKLWIFAKARVAAEAEERGKTCCAVHLCGLYAFRIWSSSWVGPPPSTGGSSTWYKNWDRVPTSVSHRCSFRCHLCFMRLLKHFKIKSYWVYFNVNKACKRFVIIENFWCFVMVIVDNTGQYFQCFNMVILDITGLYTKWVDA